jgi:hypothetical protein
MPLLVLLVLALTVGLTAGLTTWRYPRFAKPSAAPANDTARKVGEAVGRHRSLRAVLHARLDPAVATGLALTLALVFAIGGGLLLGVLAYLVRANSHVVGIDNSVGKWGNRHASAMSMHVLNVITQLGGIYLIILLCVVLAVGETIRERSVWVAPFIVAVMGGAEILTATVKHLADRVRPAFNPAAATLGGRRSPAATRRQLPPSMPLRRFSSVGGAVARRERCSRVSRRGSPSPSRRAACCSTCTG